MGLWVRAHATVKNMGSLGDSDAEKGGLLSLTYASPPEWDCPPPPDSHQSGTDKSTGKNTFFDLKTGKKLSVDDTHVPFSILMDPLRKSHVDREILRKKHFENIFYST